MSNYTYPAADDLSDKDALASGDSEKLILGSDLEAEFSAIATAIATKLDTSDRATKAQAEGGVSNAVYVTPLRVAQWAGANAGIVSGLQALADPDADRLLFWDDSEGEVAYLTVGSGITLSGTTLSADASALDITALSGYDANQHVDHTAVTLTAGEGLTGGGTIAASRSFALDVNGLTAEASLDTAADYVPVYDASAGAHRKALLSTITGAAAIKSGRWTRSTSQALSASTEATVIFNSEQHDTLAKGSFSTAAGTYTASEAVTVLVTVGVRIEDMPQTSSLRINIQVNGSLRAQTVILQAGFSGTADMTDCIAVPLSLSSSDVVRVRADPSDQAMTIGGSQATFIGIVELT